MALNPNLLYSTFKNTSGHARVFGFLPPHGRRLAAGETVTVRGNLIATLGASRKERVFKSFERACDPEQNGSMEIISTPNLFLQDLSTGVTSIITVTDGVLGVAEPITGSSAAV